jgi:hypothetical protein
MTRASLQVELYSWGDPRHAEIGAAIENAGPHVARNLRMCVFYGGERLRSHMEPQHVLLPDDLPVPFNFTLPLSPEPLSNPEDEPIAAYPHGTPIRVQFTYTDGDRTTVPFSRCFTFQWGDSPEQSVSVLVPCPRESFGGEHEP